MKILDQNEIDKIAAKLYIKDPKEQEKFVNDEQYKLLGPGFFSLNYDISLDLCSKARREFLAFEWSNIVDFYKIDDEFGS